VLGEADMTLAHLVFAVATTAYILLAIQLEERDLVAEHGVEYETYRRRVPMLVPGTRTTSASTSAGRVPARGALTKHLLVLIVPYLTLLGLESLPASAQGPVSVLAARSARDRGAGGALALLQGRAATWPRANRCRPAPR
jgi:hypothetical protein